MDADTRGRCEEGCGSEGCDVGCVTVEGVVMRRWARKCSNGICQCSGVIGGVWQSCGGDVALEKCLTAFPQSQRNVVA